VGISFLNAIAYHASPLCSCVFRSLKVDADVEITFSTSEEQLHSRLGQRLHFPVDNSLMYVESIYK
jgi:hypothetical protein